MKYSLLSVLFFLVAIVANADEHESKQRLRLYLFVTERTETIHKTIVYDIRVHGPGSVWSKKPHIRYMKDERIQGVIGSYTKYAFSNFVKLSEKESGQFWATLSELGADSLEGENEYKKGKWSEELDYNLGGKRRYLSFYTEPEKGSKRNRIHKLIFDLCRGKEVDRLREPYEIRLAMGADINFTIYIKADIPIWYPKKYLYKGIKEIKELENGRVSVIFIEDSGLPSIQGKLLYAKWDLGKYKYQTVGRVWTNTTKTKLEGDDREPRDTSLEEILSNPIAYDGKRVRVTGNYHSRFEYRGLSTEDKSVWLGEASTFARQEDVIFQNDSFMTVEGTFLAGPRGHLGMFPGEIARVTKIEVKGRKSPN